MTGLRFEFRVLDEEGDCLVEDFTTIPGVDRIDQFGNCETVDIHVGAALRGIRREAPMREARRLAEIELEAEEAEA